MSESVGYNWDKNRTRTGCYTTLVFHSGEETYKEIQRQHERRITIHVRQRQSTRSIFDLTLFAESLCLTSPSEDVLALLSKI